MFKKQSYVVDIMQISKYDEKAQELATWLKVNHSEFWSKLEYFEIEADSLEKNGLEDWSQFQAEFDAAQTELTRTLLSVYEAKDLVELVYIRRAIRKICRIELGLNI